MLVTKNRRKRDNRLKYTFVALLAFFPIFSLSAQYDKTFSDYFSSSRDFAIRQMAGEIDAKTDTLLGNCLDTLFAGKVTAVNRLSSRILKLAPGNAFAHVLRSVSRADLDSLDLAFADIDTALALAPKLMIAYTVKSSYYQWKGEHRKAREVLEMADVQLPDRPEPIFLLGALDWNTNRRVRARKQWEVSVARDSCYAPARLAILAQRSSAGRTARGIEELEELLDCNDVSPDIYHRLALEERDRNQDGKALEYINIALDLAPGQANFLRFRSGLLYEQGDVVDAIEDLYDVYAAQTNRRSQSFRALVSKRDRMEPALNQYMAHKFSYPEDLRAMLARQLLELNQYDDTELRKSTKALLQSKHRGNADLLYLAALGKYQAGKEETDARELIAEALDADPGIAYLYYLRGTQLLEEKEYRSAYDDYSRMMELRPNSVVPLHGMAKVLEATGREKAALNIYRSALAIDSFDIVSLLRLGEIHYGNQQFPEALAFFDRYLDEEDDGATIRHHRATCRYLIGNLEGAGDDLRELSDFYRTNNLDAQNLRGVVLTAQDSTSAALAVYNAILFKDANFTNAYLNRARLYAKTEDWQKCANDLERIAGTDPNNAFVHYELGVARFELNDPKACLPIKRAQTLGYKVPAEVLEKICGL